MKKDYKNLSEEEKKKRAFKERVCAICKKTFMQSEFSMIVCSPECKEIHRTKSIDNAKKVNYKPTRLEKPIHCPLCGREFFYEHYYTQHKNETYKRQQRGLFGCRGYEKNILKAKEQRIVERQCAYCGKYFVTELAAFRKEAWGEQTDDEKSQRIKLKESLAKHPPFCSQECKEMWNERVQRKKEEAQTDVVLNEDTFSSSSSNDSGKQSSADPAGIKFKKRSTIFIF